MLDACRDCDGPARTVDFQNLGLNINPWTLHLQGATLDRRAECCASGVLDACGDCDGPARTVDAQGVCCASKVLDAGGFCCSRCCTRRVWSHGVRLGLGLLRVQGPGRWRPLLLQVLEQASRVWLHGSRWHATAGHTWHTWHILRW